jgi:hemoglobin/transferrin/lactoferrin receptor protein
MMRLFLITLFLLGANTVFSQQKQQDSVYKDLSEVIISINKWEQQQNEVPNKITKINKSAIVFNNPQTAADLLAQTGAVFIQKSQLGGGSPMIRGFATNRVLLVVDGVRMNNAIYRSGNLQNIISIDALNTETAEVIFGPGSLIYGSDAIGGVMDFHSLQARLAASEKTSIKGSALTRYSSANNENTVHADINIGLRKWAFLSSFTYSKFDDLKIGIHGGQDNYLRPEYVERINGIDSIVKNSNNRVQAFSGYNQVNFNQKIRFKPNRYTDLQYSFTYAGTGNAPRYDRLIQYSNGRLRFAEWYYGPMLWRMHTLQANFTKKNKWYDEAKLVAAYQNYEESRIDRTRNNNNRNTQTEKVAAYSFNADLNKELAKGILFYGAEYVYNKVGSFGQTTNIINGSKTPLTSRYPNGSEWSTAGIYTSYKINLQPKITFTTGLRLGANALNGSFDTSIIKFPYQQFSLNKAALTGNAGLVYRPKEYLQLNANIATGYRMPNIDDIGKLFESAPGNITVPNPDLGAEYAWNFETGFIYSKENKYHLELNLFYSLLNNAIVRRPSTFNGQDSILFGGVLSRVEQLQNTAKATVWGLQANVQLCITQKLQFETAANLVKGKETDDTKNQQVPLRHAPPFYGNTSVKMQHKKWKFELVSFYNSAIKNKNLAPSEQAKIAIYAKDSNGKPYSPGWYTLNLRSAFAITKTLTASLGWENITNQRYRSYASGIVAAGSNIIASARFVF